MLRASRTNRPRRGIATLELVLVFPMLLALVSGLFLIARCDVAKVQAATDARRQAWQNRPQARPGSPLSVNLVYDPMESRVDSPPSQRVVALGPGFAGQTQTAHSHNTLIANPWAFSAVPFPSLAQNVIPHTTVLSLIDYGVVGGICQAMEIAYPNGPMFFPIGVGISFTNYALVAMGAILLPSVPYAGYNLFEAAQGKAGW